MEQNTDLLNERFFKRKCELIKRQTGKRSQEEIKETFQRLLRVITLQSNTPGEMLNSYPVPDHGEKSSVQWHPVSHSASSCVLLTVIQQTTKPLNSGNLPLRFCIMDFGKQTGKFWGRTFINRALCLLKQAAGVGRTLWFSGHGGCWTLWMMCWEIYYALIYVLRMMLQSLWHSY